MKILPVAVELLHADRRTDMTKLIVAFCNFANAPKTLFSCLTLQDGHFTITSSAILRKFLENLFMIRPLPTPPCTFWQPKSNIVRDGHRQIYQSVDVLIFTSAQLVLQIIRS